MGLRWIDFSILVAYLCTLVMIGLRFSRRQNTTEAYYVAKRSIPAWAMGLSLLATLISSVTFIAYPGAAYSGDWSLLVPGFMAVLSLAVVGAILIPFYRHVVRMSAYE
jgi:SSS family solute:Na+ symporter